MIADTTDLLNDPTIPQLFGSLTSSDGDVIDLYRTPAFNHLWMVRYNPTKGETSDKAWTNGGSEGLRAGLPVCGSTKYPAYEMRSAYALIGRLIVEQGWVMK